MKNASGVSGSVFFRFSMALPRRLRLARRRLPWMPRALCPARSSKQDADAAVSAAQLLALFEGGALARRAWFSWLVLLASLASPASPASPPFGFCYA